MHSYGAGGASRRCREWLGGSSEDGRSVMDGERGGKPERPQFV